MNEWSIWKLIKAGFWLGIGFIIPSLAVYGLGTIAVVGLSPILMEASVNQIQDTIEENEDFSKFREQFDMTAQVKILEYSEAESVDQLLILGKIQNAGKTKVGSIQLEAELYDDSGKFVYECNEYINKSLKADEVENFQIKCGCKGQPVPSHASATVRVVSASSY
ncbi:MAG: FxLYD domain-containing protein [Candidatus Thiodiazotropha sp.]